MFWKYYDFKYMPFTKSSKTALKSSTLQPSLSRPLLTLCTHRSSPDSGFWLWMSDVGQQSSVRISVPLDVPVKQRLLYFPCWNCLLQANPSQLPYPLQIVNVFRMSACNIHGPPYFLFSHVTWDNLLSCLGKIFQLLTVSPLEFLFVKGNNRPGELLLLWDSPLTLAHCCLFFFFVFFLIIFR